MNNQPVTNINEYRKPEQTSDKESWVARHPYLHKFTGLVAVAATAVTVYAATITAPNSETANFEQNPVVNEAEPTVDKRLVIKFNDYGQGAIAAVHEALEKEGVDAKEFGIRSVNKLGNDISEYFDDNVQLGDVIEVQLLSNGAIQLAEYQPPQE